ncbi:MAG: TraR/DksA C4-type zinc finger protein [Chthoniobacterales bacterium]|nr:TraR/DksA C4-type zinc finger protein [Chthoniobacterales bacterium]
MAAKKKKPPAKPARKPAAKTKPAAAKKKRPAPAKKSASSPKKSASKKSPVRASKAPLVGTRDMLAFGQPVTKERRLNPWLKKQQLRLLALKDTLLDSMTGVARDNLRNGHDSHEVSAHGLHQADAGSDAYDRDFALNLLSQEQDALFEIDEALKRIARGTYGTCEMSGKPIPKARLEARPFARFTVECQGEIERKNRFNRIRQPVTRLFETADDESGEESDEEAAADSKD